MTTVIIAVVVLAVLGAIFGLVLAIASKVFAVEVDPREEAILGCLPGATAAAAAIPAAPAMPPLWSREWPQSMPAPPAARRWPPRSARLWACPLAPQ